ncbi:hypothetical protein F0562_031476 [Nyssa sinensis]|uniref:Uncharacterized protein n=1 Tax=Nyssa sinensis TaxID=561372 RepID=A0A5J5AU93_9ASTE|nr:hypothetical protein F0562_031476 [Nyssa sinensis]
MTNQMTPKVRLVRCPRCRRVLPEVAEVPVYICGVCGTILQAKNRKNNTQNSESCLNGTDIAQKNKLEHVSEDKEAGSLNQQATLPSTEALDNSGRDQNEPGECNTEQTGIIISSEEHSLTERACQNEETSLEAQVHTQPGECNREQTGIIISSDENSSTELTGQNEETSPEARVHTEVEEDKCSLDQNVGSYQDEFGDSNRECPGGINFADEVSPSIERNHCENEELNLSPIARAHVEVDENKYSSEENNGRNRNESGDCDREGPGKINFSNEVPSSTELSCQEIEESSPASREGSGKINFSNKVPSSTELSCHEIEESSLVSREGPGKINFSNKVPSSTELSCHEIEESSRVSAEDENFKSRFIFRSSSAENFMATRPRDSTITAQRPLGQSISSDNLISPYNEQLEQFQKSVLHGLDRVSSVDKLENALVNPSSELSVNHRDMLKSPTTRSYAYDGSVSSYDGTDDQVQDCHLPLSERNFKAADFITTKGIPRRDEYMVANMMSGNLEMQHQARNSSSISLEKQHYAMKSSKWHQDQLLDPRRHGRPFRSRMRLETDEHLSRVPFYSRRSQADHGNGSPSSYRQNEFQCCSSFHSPDKPKYPEQEKMELLRMVYELQGQLHRTSISEGKENGRFPAGVNWKEKQIPSYYDRVAPDVEMFHDLNHLNYLRRPGRCSQGKIWSQQCKVSHIPFSGEAAGCRPQVDCSCLYCCPQDWQCSAQLPPRVIFHNKGQYMVHPHQKCYNLYSSRPSSPQHYTGSEFSLWSHDMKSEDMWHKDYEVKKSERHHSVKRHFRPIAGGAPIIACYHCLELLQLPADFLLLRRRCHRLRCTACSKVLKFSLRNKSHIIPHTPDAIEPPPSEINDHSDAISMRGSASASHANYCPHGDPVSCSDDYGLSFCRSCSTEGEPYSLTPPLHILERNNDRNMSSGSSFEPMEEIREMKPVLKQSQNNKKNPVGTFESVGPSSRMSRPQKFSSEIVELPPAAASPLHQLMGYSSPSQVIRGSGVGTSTYFSEEK